MKGTSGRRVDRFGRQCRNESQRCAVKWIQVTQEKDK